MRPGDPHVVPGELLVMPGRAPPDRHQVVADDLAVGVLPVVLSTRIMVNSLGSQSTPPSCPLLNGSLMSSAPMLAGSSTCRISIAEFFVPSIRSMSIRQWALCMCGSVRCPGRFWPVAPDAEADRAVVVERIRHDVHVIAGLERTPEHQLLAAPHAVGEVLPDHAPVAELADDGRVGIALERRHQLPLSTAVFLAHLGQGEGEAGQVEVADVARLVIGDEELGDAGVVEDLDPVLAQVPLVPGAR